MHGVAAEKIKVVPRGCDAEKLARDATGWGAGAISRTLALGGG